MRPAWGRRILALLIDYLLILAWGVVVGGVTLVVALVTGRLVNWLEFGTAAAELLGFLVLVLPIGIYLFASEASTRQATLGKRVMGLTVVVARGDLRPSRRRVLVRTVVKLLPWEVAHFFVWQVVSRVSTAPGDFPVWLAAGLVVANLLPIAYVVVVILQPQRRGPHDLLAGTRVVRVVEPASH